MQFQLNIDIPEPLQKISYGQKILLTGSCFTEHIGNALQELKFDVLQNPNGILFDPASVCNSLMAYTENKQYREQDLFLLNEVWNSWDHHSRFSHMDKTKALEQINKAQERAHKFLKTADWLIITLGSSFCYRLTQTSELATHNPGAIAANCHKAPSQWFNKQLLEIEEIKSLLDNTYHRLKEFNSDLKLIFTISPVRHIRDGVTDNNRSKARLIEATHHTVNKFEGLWYFPAYELLIDVLRDYRFYDIDMVHPNYPGTQFVMEKFTTVFIDEASQKIARQVKDISIARKHKPFHPGTAAHKNFLKSYAGITGALMDKHPFLPLQEELEYFSAYKTL